MDRTNYQCLSRNNWNVAIVVTILLLSIVVVIALVDHYAKPTVDNSTVTTLDLNRYLGEWYELARLDHRFERGMTHSTADYSIRGDGMIAVKNAGLKDGRWKTEYARAKITTTPGLLRVSFWGPFYNDYRVLMVDPDYSYALVGGGSRDYLWIIARTRTLPDDIRSMLIAEANLRGYDTRHLIWVDQSTPF